jgi:hypothetical protein
MKMKNTNKAAKEVCDAKNRLNAAIESIYKTLFADNAIPSHEQHKELSLAYVKLNDTIMSEQFRREFPRDTRPGCRLCDEETCEGCVFANTDSTEEIAR